MYAKKMSTQQILILVVVRRRRRVCSSAIGVHRLFTKWPLAMLRMLRRTRCALDAETASVYIFVEDNIDENYDGDSRRVL